MYHHRIIDAKAGGGAAAAANAVKTGKFKMHPNEAMKVLNIEKSSLSKEILEEVKHTNIPSIHFY